MADPWMTPDQVKKYIPKGQAAPKTVPVDDVPVGEYEIGCLGTSERVRIDLPVSEPALYTRSAEALERLAMAFRAAAKAQLPAPSDGDYKHERLMVILALKHQVGGVQRWLADLWQKQKKRRQ